MNESLFFEVLDFMGLSFPIKGPFILTSSNQLYLKMIAWLNQDAKCICGEGFNEGELHHALISKRDIMGHPDPDIIHDSRNVLLLHVACHRKINRAESYRLLSHIFTHEVIDKWYGSVGFKSRLPLILSPF